MGRRHEGFDEFYAAEMRPLRRLAYLLTGSWTEAEELAQDAMERTFRAWSRVAEGDNPRAYVRTVLVNRHRSILRRALVEAKHATGRAEPDAAPADLSEDRMVLWEAVSRLAPRYRQAVVLRYYEDLPDAEIARIMRCSVSTVKTLVQRGLKRLRHEPGVGREVAAVGGERA